MVALHAVAVRKVAGSRRGGIGERHHRVIVSWRVTSTDERRERAHRGAGDEERENEVDDPGAETQHV